MGWIISFAMLAAAVVFGGELSADVLVVTAGLFAIAGGVVTAGLAVKEALTKKG